jgi:hypothetical protein
MADAPLPPDVFRSLVQCLADLVLADLEHEDLEADLSDVEASDQDVKLSPHSRRPT